MLVVVNQLKIKESEIEDVSLQDENQPKGTLWNQISVTMTPFFFLMSQREVWTQRCHVVCHEVPKTSTGY